MKPSTIAVALLTAPLSAVVAQRAGGGANPAPQYKRMKTVRGGSVTSASSNEGDLLATCTSLAAQGSCNDNNDCTWCEAGAVPSACYPTNMTSKLPQGVFECGRSKTSVSAEAGALKADLSAIAKTVVTEAKKTEEVKFDKKGKQTFTLGDSVLTMDAAEVDKDFCDASSPLSMAGYMNVKGSKFDTSSDKNLFYWFFEKRTTSQLPSTPKVGAEADSAWPWSKPNPPKKDEQKPEPSKPSEDKGKKEKKKDTYDENTPFIVWLTGGPGCSSSLALLTENGPCSVEDDGATTKVNPHSWTESAHVLWLDQPANVGYSYGQDNDTNEEMISEDAYYFLQAFFKSTEGQKYKNSPLFIVGESYGGHYAPAIAHRIMRGNKDLKEGLDKLNLKGLAVGNGLTDPEEQYKWYSEMAYKNSHGLEVITEDTYNMMKQSEPLCTKGIAQCNTGDGMLNSFACQAAFAYCNTALTTPYRATGKNPYDITKKCPPNNPLCYDFSHMENFMNLDSTKKALHVDEHNPSWQTCNMMVNLSFHVDWMKNFAPYVADLLNDGVPALIYAGDIDFVCNYLGNRAWTLKLDWDHKDKFQKAPEKDWNKGGGLARSSNGLTFLQVYDAGHMVPSDQPEQALTMITQFLNGEKF